MKEPGQLQKNISIGALAKKSGLSVSALRYYESIGLLQAARREPGGARHFPNEAVGRLKVVRRLQVLGFSLGEILAQFRDRRSLARRRRRFVETVTKKVGHCLSESKALKKRAEDLKAQLRLCRSSQWRCETAVCLGLG